MTYKVLARKWRPQHFSDMIGQEHVLRALVNALDNDRLHHAYLFTGMRGVGKTTIARIFAKCLNCLTNGVSSSPCGKCSVCQDVEGGSFLDLIEVDAASRTKVDETRELLENVPYLPSQGRYKVYLIDEVHMFSNHSFNALLKTLEEPPEHVKFLLATTDPQKVPVTVLSRCLQFNLKRLSGARLTPYLAHILAEESIEAELPALELIARAADGSVRDSLSLVEQATAYGQGAVRQLDVEAMLGRVSTDRLVELLAMLATGDAPGLFAAVDRLDEYGPDYAQLLGELVSLLHRVALQQRVPGAVDPSTPGYQALAALAGQLSGESLQLWHQIGVHARRDMPFCPDPREAFDMALLRMLHFQPQHEVAAVDSIPAATPAPSGTPAVADAAAAPALQTATLTRAASEAQAAPDAACQSAPVTRTTPAEPTTPSTPKAMRASLPDEDRPDSATAASESAAAAVAAARDATGTASRNRPADTPAGTPPDNSHGGGDVTATGGVSVAQLATRPWAATVESLGLAGMPLQLAQNCVLHEAGGGKVVLHLHESAEHLRSPRFVARLQTALSALTGEDIALAIDYSAAELDTPASQAEARAAEAQRAAEASIGADPLVQQLVAGVDGTIDAGSVQPIDRPKD